MKNEARVISRNLDKKQESSTAKPPALVFTSIINKGGQDILVQLEIASLPATVGASVGAVRTAVGACVTSLMLEEDDASAVAFCDKGDSLLSELKVWALWTSGVMPGAVGATSDVGVC